MRSGTSEPCSGGEREVGDLGGQLAVADREPIAGCGLTPDDREADRAEGRGEAARAERPDLLLAQPKRLSFGRRRAQAQAAQGPVWLAPVVQAGDRLLADVAALLEIDRPLDYPRLGRHRLGAHVE